MKYFLLNIIILVIQTTILFEDVLQSSNAEAQNVNCQHHHNCYEKGKEFDKKGSRLMAFFPHRFVLEISKMTAQWNRNNCLEKCLRRSRVMTQQINHRSLLM